MAAKKKRKPKKLSDGSVPESLIQGEILGWLKETKLLHWRQNSGVVFAGRRMVRLGESGLPDIVCVVPPMGRIVGLEVKSLRGKLRPAQLDFMNKVRALGGYYFVVRSLAQAKHAIAKSLGEEQWKLLCYSKTVPE